MTRIMPETASHPETVQPVAELADYVYKSFYFSQGQPRLQYHLIQYGRNFYADQIAGLTKTDREVIRTRAEQKALSWVQKGPHASVEEASKISSYEVPDVVSSWIEKIEDMLVDPDPIEDTQATSPEALDMQTSRLLVAADHEWLAVAGGRPNKNSNSKSEYHDRFLSHLIHYGLLENPTHNAALDYFFKRMKATLLARLSQPERDFEAELHSIDYTSASVNAKLKKVFEIHIDHHPEDRERIEQALNSVPVVSR